MTDYGHDLQFGGFVTPVAQQVDQVVELAVQADRDGLDLITFQDHPYQSAFVDTWTLITFVAARTSRIKLSANVFNLPLRPPAVLARSVASLDRMSGGRIDVGLGAGAFSEAIQAMGGDHRSPAESITALDEAITVMRELWDVEQRGGVRFHGQTYRLDGAKRGPAPLHRPEIWIGAYKPKMLQLTGRRADGWLPSQGFMQSGDLTTGNAIIDEAATAAGRAPQEIRRMLNLDSTDPSRLTDLALGEGVSTFILMSDEAQALRHFAAETAPAVRAAVASARSAR